MLLGPTQADFKELASGYQALEAPVLDGRGDLLFSDLKRSGVHRLHPDGRTDVLLDGRPAIGGLCLHRDGGFVASGPDLTHFRDGTARVLLGPGDVIDKPGTKVVGFNDLCPDGSGRVLVGLLRTDDHGQPAPGELVMVTGEHMSSVLDVDVHPNGIALSPDGSEVYCADTFRRRVVIFSADGDATPAFAGWFSTAQVDGFPDGMAVDTEGFIWLAFYRGWSLARFDPHGKLDRVISTPAHKPLSLCFAGPGRSEMYVVTARSDEQPDHTGSVLLVDVGCQGLPRPLATI